MTAAELRATLADRNARGASYIVGRAKTGTHVHLAYNQGPSFCGIRRVAPVDLAGVRDDKVMSLCEKCFPAATR